METEGIKRIFSQSETTRQLQYTECFGVGDSKAYSEIFYDNVHVEKRNVLGSAQWTRTKASWNSSPETEKEEQIDGEEKLMDALIDKLHTIMALPLEVIVEIWGE
jgi:hypothetical protein